MLDGKQSRGEFGGTDNENDGRLDVYRGDTTGGQNLVEKMIRAALDYNKSESKRWSVSVEMIQACSGAGLQA